MKEYFTSLVNALVKQWKTLSNAANFNDEGTLMSYSVIVQFHLKHYAKYKRTDKLDREVRSLLKVSITTIQSAQGLLTNMLSCWTAYDENSVKAIRFGKCYQHNP